MYIAYCYKEYELKDQKVKSNEKESLKQFKNRINNCFPSEEGWTKEIVKVSFIRLK